MGQFPNKNFDVRYEPKSPNMVPLLPTIINVRVEIIVNHRSQNGLKRIWTPYPVIMRSIKINVANLGPIQVRTKSMNQRVMIEAIKIQEISEGMVSWIKSILRYVGLRFIGKSMIQGYFHISKERGLQSEILRFILMISAVLQTDLKTKKCAWSNPCSKHSTNYTWF